MKAGSGKISSAQMRRIRAFALRQCAQNDFNHNATHVELTARWTKYFAHKEKTDQQVCLAAAYLHDIARSKVAGRHGPAGAVMARDFLQSIHVDDAVIRQICYAVRTHDAGGKKESKEAEVLWDADKLQSIGPYGYLRIVSHHLHYDTRDIMRVHALTMKRHRFFFRRFYTKTGKRIARLLHSSTTVFCSMLEAARIPQPDAFDKKTA
jgi:HD superfamily phosphodiesterase